MYLKGGAHAVIVVFPKSLTVRVFLQSASHTLRPGDTITLPELLPAWQLPVSEIFAEL